MQVSIYPLCSQQDKVQGRHILSTCAAVKQLTFLMQRMAALDWNPKILLPTDADSYPSIDYFLAQLPLSNAEQRVHWDTVLLRSFFRGASVAVCHHQLLAIPTRALFPDLPIVQMCTVQPEPIMVHAWDAADLVVAQSDVMAEYIRKQTATPVSIWPLAYDADLSWYPDNSDRPIDVLFVNRCSDSNYTHHIEFMAALPLMCDLTVVFVDPTRYLESKGFHVATTHDYFKALHRSKVAVAFNNNMCGGLSIREACAAGCTAVTSDAKCFVRMGGKHLVEEFSAACINEAIRRALTDPVRTDVSFESYQASWPGVERDIRACWAGRSR